MSLPLFDRLTRDLLADDLEGMATLFESHGESPPQLIWSPVPDDLPYEQLRFLLRYWTQKRAGAEIPPASAISPVEMLPALGYIILLDVVEDGADFRYRLYGTEIAERTGVDWTGRLVSDMAGKSYTALFYAAVYKAALVRRQPVATVSASPRYVAATQWSRVVLPLSDAAGRIVRFLVGNVPGTWRKPE